MRKFAISTIAAATLLVGGLTGCNTDNQASDTGTFRSAGTEQYQVTGPRGTTGARYTGEGPITDMFTDDDRRTSKVQRYDDNRTRGYRVIEGSRLGVQNKQNPYNNGRYTDQTLNQRRFNGQNVRRQTTDYIRKNNAITGQSVNNTGHPRLTENGRLNRIPQQANINNDQIERTVESMANVKDCHVISRGDSIIIGVDTDGNNRGQLENQIRERVQQMVQGKNIYVVTDEEQVNRVRTLGERIRTGGANVMEEVGTDINGMINDLARAAKRPFENNR